MAAGAQPALEPTTETKTEAQVAAAKPVTLKDRIIAKLTALFAHNERLGVTRYF